MLLTVKPRLQVETWSLYWKQASRTETRCLDPIELEVEDGCTISSLCNQAAAHLGWPPEDGLTRLEGFTDSWQRALRRGRLLDQAASMADAGLVTGDVLTFVRVQLVAEGWKVKDDHALTDSDDDDN